MSDPLPQVHVDQLRVGVFITLETNWLDHPFLVNSFLIKNEKQLRTLREMGLRSVSFDPARSQVQPGELDHEPAAPAAPHLEPADQQAMEAKRQRAARMEQHRERVRRCEKEYGSCAASTKSVIDGILRDPAQASAQAGRIVGSVASSFLHEQGASVMLVASKRMDEANQQHALNAMVLTLLLAKGLGLKPEIFEACGMGALLHDIGKVRINPSVLRNPQRSRHEEALYRMHGEYGLQLIGEHVPPPVRATIREHHEHCDGSGFPDGRTREQINPVARMVAITDRYDRLCNPPAIGDAMTPAEALSQMYAREAARYDKQMLSVFIKELGVYPPGSFVRLSNGAIAIVIAVTPGNTLKPTVLVYEPGVPRREALVLDLAEVDEVTIESVLRPAVLEQSIVEYLNPRMRLAYFAQKAG